LVRSLEDNSQLNISSLALTQPFKIILPKVKSRYYYSFDIAINSNVSTAGASYTFQISCFQLKNFSNVLVSYANINIQMNTLPSRGSFSIDPSAGFALTDIFAFSAIN
jgi:hypothetical protein